MRWSVAYSSALLSGVFTTTSAFLPVRRHHVGGMGWDNDDFLDALSKGPEALDEANKQYDRLKQFGQSNPDNEDFDPVAATGGDKNIPDAADVNRVGDGMDELPDEGNVKGAEITAEQIERIKKTNEEETAGGGEMFKKLMERAEKGGKKPPPELAQQPPPPAPATGGGGGGPVLPAGFENLSVEAQAALFRELMKNPADAVPQQQFPPAPGDRPPATGQPKVAPDGRRIGRNRDADAIVNSSDVYFAQLKVDSTSRTLARRAGEADKAEAVFQDPRIKEIKLHVNPYMEEARKKEKEMLETSADELIIPNMYADEPPADLSDTGISYKEKLQQMKKRKNNPKAQTLPPPDTREPVVEDIHKTEPPPRKAPASASFVEGESVSSQQLDTKEEETVPSPAPTRVEAKTIAKKTVPPPAPAAKTPPAVSSKPPPVSVKAPPAPAPAAKTPPAVSSKPPPVAVKAPPAPAPASRAKASTRATPPASSEAAKDPEEMRRDIRTLMGLLLKHRGGPGFGAGRIQGAEMARFEKLATEIVATLREETQAAPPQSGAISQDSNEAPKPPASQSSAPQAPTAHSVTGGNAPQAGSVPTIESVDSMIACIDGAITMYRNSPPELQDSVLVTLRAALLSAVNTCNELVGDSNMDFNANASSDQDTPASVRIKSMIACIEGAITMYRNSPQDLKQPVLVTLRAALLSAVHTCNAVIADNDVATFAATMPTAPTQVVDTVSEAAKEDQEGEVLRIDGSDENSQFLETVYEKLQSAHGDGKMGLRKDLSAADAESLANDISQMRSILVEELDSGIPEAASEASTPQASSSGTASKYQEMLAKARADKDAERGTK